MSGRLDKDDYVCARDPGTDPGELRRLSGRPDLIVRAAVAANEAAHADTLRTLSSDRSQRVCLAVAWNPRTPVEILVALSEDPDSDVRAAVAQHPATPAAVLERLARDPHPRVPMRVAQNPTPRPNFTSGSRGSRSSRRSRPPCPRRNPDVRHRLRWPAPRPPSPDAIRRPWAIR